MLRNLLFFTTHSPSETSIIHGSRPWKTALIRGKTALMFWNTPFYRLIWLSEAKSTQKITANSTYWKAKLTEAGGVARSKGKKGLFSGSTLSGQEAKKTCSFSPSILRRRPLSYMVPDYGKQH